MAGPISIAPWSARAVPPAVDSAFVRLWRGFTTARVAIALVLLLLLVTLYLLGPQQNSQRLPIVLCGAYLCGALGVRLFTKPLRPGKTFDLQWVLTIGVDLLTFSTLQFMQTGGINYSPLLAVPVLMASVLGSALLAFGTAAGVTLLLLAEVWLLGLQSPSDMAPRFLQAGLTGTGYFALAFLANQLALRLASEEKIARRSQSVARMQAQVNELVIEALPDGVLVVDPQGEVHAANPTAIALLGCGDAARRSPFLLSAQEAWQPLVEMAQLTFLLHGAQLGDIAIADPAAGPPRRVFVRTRLTAPQDNPEDSLCVMFLEDLREMETRLRTEKLAAMGRMSAAVAHEIRNPLAATAQANALLEEDLHEPAHRQLSGLVRKNAQRLARIVEEILNVSQVRHQGAAATSPALELDAAVASACTDWASQTHSGARLALTLQAGRASVPFEADHLRRVLINLLDNALRYAGGQADSIQVATSAAGLVVWSDGPALGPAVQRHLFEPFFSSESRSSGLGLFICRELCERHGAVIGYRRCAAPAGLTRAGNEFFVRFRALVKPLDGSAASKTMTA